MNNYERLNEVRNIISKEFIKAFDQKEDNTSDLCYAWVLLSATMNQLRRVGKITK